MEQVEWYPALIRNTSHRMVYMRILYYAYTMYIPKIYIVYPKKIYYIYTKYIRCIYIVYTIYILGICNVYTKDNHVVFTMNILGIYYITGISDPDRYMHGIYMVYVWYISCI